MEEKKTKNKLIKISDIIVIIIGIVILIFGLNYIPEKEENSWSSSYHIGESKKAQEEQEEEVKVQNTIIIVGFAITVFGVACIIKRVLDKKDTKFEKNDNSTSVKIKELQKMLNEKIITEEEYEKKKKEILDKM